MKFNLVFDIQTGAIELISQLTRIILRFIQKSIELAWCISDNLISAITCWEMESTVDLWRNVLGMPKILWKLPDTWDKNKK
jgi:hypothetical protein